MISTSTTPKLSPLEEFELGLKNHDNNSKLFLMISTSTTPKLSPLEEFELGLKNQIEQFKTKRYGRTL